MVQARGGQAEGRTGWKSRVIMVITTADVFSTRNQVNRKERSSRPQMSYISRNISKEQGLYFCKCPRAVWNDLTVVCPSLVSFPRRRKGGMVIIYRKMDMVYAKMFYGGWHPPASLLNSSSLLTLRRKNYCWIEDVRSYGKNLFIKNIVEIDISPWIRHCPNRPLLFSSGWESVISYLEHVLKILKGPKNVCFRNEKSSQTLCAECSSSTLNSSTIVRDANCELFSTFYDNVTRMVCELKHSNSATSLAVFYAILCFDIFQPKLDYLHSQRLLSMKLI